MTSTQDTGIETRATWQEFVNYSGMYEGQRVMGTWSPCAGRYVIPGETVVIRDEFGYWRNEEPVTFLGRTSYGDFRYREPEGATRLTVWQVCRGVCPLDCGCDHVAGMVTTSEVDRVAREALAELARWETEGGSVQ